MQNKEKMSQTPHNRQFPPLGSAKSKLNDRKQVKAAHTRKMHEIQNHLQTGLISPEQLNDLIKNLKQLYKQLHKQKSKSLYPSCIVFVSIYFYSMQIKTKMFS